MARLDVAALIPAPSSPPPSRSPARRTDATDAFNSFLKSARSRRAQQTRDTSESDAPPAPPKSEPAKRPSDDHRDEAVDRQPVVSAASVDPSTTPPTETTQSVTGAVEGQVDPSTAPREDGATSSADGNQVNVTTPTQSVDAAAAQAAAGAEAFLNARFGSQTGDAHVEARTAPTNVAGDQVAVPQVRSDAQLVAAQQAVANDEAIAAVSLEATEDTSGVTAETSPDDESADADDSPGVRTASQRLTERRDNESAHVIRTKPDQTQTHVKTDHPAVTQSSENARDEIKRPVPTTQNTAVREATNIAADPRLNSEANLGGNQDGQTPQGQRDPSAEAARLQVALGFAESAGPELDDVFGDSTTDRAGDFATRLQAAQDAAPKASAGAAAVASVQTPSVSATSSQSTGDVKAVGTTGIVDDPTPVPLDRLAHTVRAHIDGDRWQVRLQLDPPELGKVQLDVQMKDNGLHVRMHVAGEEVRKLVESRMRELVDGLRDQDIKVSQTTVTVRGAAQSGNENAGDPRESGLFRDAQQHADGGRAHSDAGSHRDGGRGEPAWRSDTPEWRGAARATGGAAIGTSGSGVGRLDLVA